MTSPGPRPSTASTCRRSTPLSTPSPVTARSNCPLPFAAAPSSASPRFARCPGAEVAALLGERPYLATFNLEPLSGTAVFLLSLQTVVRMLDFRLGGGTQPAFAGHNDLTETDFAVLSGVVTPLLTELATSLSRFEEVTAVPAVQESSIQFVQARGTGRDVPRHELRSSAWATTNPAEMIFALPFPLVRQITEAVRSAAAAVTTRRCLSTNPL